MDDFYSASAQISSAGKHIVAFDWPNCCYGFAANDASGWDWQTLPCDNFDGLPEMAIDENGSAYLFFDVDLDPSQDFHSELVCWTNRSGQWTKETVFSAEPGCRYEGLSVKAGPGGTIAVAGHLVKHVHTGSSQWSKLVYYERGPNGTWSTETVVDRSDGFAGSDGDDYTGAQPELEFDDSGQPHIVFTDHASSHFTHAWESVGQIRHAVRNDGVWQVETVYRQSDTIHQAMVDPTIAMFGQQTAIAGLAVDHLRGPRRPSAFRQYVAADDSRRNSPASRD